MPPLVTRAWISNPRLALELVNVEVRVAVPKLSLWVMVTSGKVCSAVRLANFLVAQKYHLQLLPMASSVVEYQ